MELQEYMAKKIDNIKVDRMKTARWTAMRDKQMARSGDRYRCEAEATLALPPLVGHAGAASTAGAPSELRLTAHNYPWSTLV